MFYFRRFERLYKCFRGHEFHLCTRFFEFFLCSFCSIIPARIIGFSIFELRKPSLFEMIGKPEFSPRWKYFSFWSRIRNPYDQCVFESCCLLYEFIIRYTIDTFELYDSEKISEKFLSPRILGRMTKIKNRESTTFEIFSIGRRWSPVIIEIFRVVFFFGEEMHKWSISGNSTKGNYVIWDFCHVDRSGAEWRHLALIELADFSTSDFRLPLEMTIKEGLFGTF